MRGEPRRDERCSQTEMSFVHRLLAEINRAKVNTSAPTADRRLG